MYLVELYELRCHDLFTIDDLPLLTATLLARRDGLMVSLARLLVNPIFAIYSLISLAEPL